MNKIVLFIALVLTYPICLSRVFSEEPWSVERQHPVTNDTLVAQQKHSSSDLTLSGVTAVVLRFYQNYISPLDGATCYYRPTCSLYAAWAVQKYGTLKGSIMAADRLIRCHGGQSDSRLDFPHDQSHPTEK